MNNKIYYHYCSVDKINYELLDLYWELGKNIVSKQKNAK